MNSTKIKVRVQHNNLKKLLCIYYIDTLYTANTVNPGSIVTQV